jgi:hypothetical protein
VQGGGGTWILNTGWERGGVWPKAEKKNSDMVYFHHKLGCGTAPNASELVTDVWKLSRYLFI